MAVGAWAVLAAALPASADTLRLTIQPIQVCDDAGLACANPDRTLFGSLTRAIWLQAGIWFTALEWQAVFSSSLLDATLLELAGQASETSGVLNVWFVETVLGCDPFGAVYACAFVGGNGIAIAAQAIAERRGDVLAHELGHNLGLGHVLDPLNLMAGGERRVIPSRLEEVYPLGPLDRLERDQVLIARASPHLVPVPEPGTLTLVLVGAGTLTLRRRLSGRSRPRPLEARGRSAAPKGGSVQATCRRPTTIR